MIQELLVKAAWAIAVKLLESAALEELLVWALRSLAASTKTNVDDSLVEVVAKYLGDKKDGAATPS